MRWEVLVMMALLGAVNLIGRWVAARQKAKQREQEALGESGKPRERPVQSPRVRVERPGASPPRPSQPVPAPAARTKVVKREEARPVVRPAPSPVVAKVAAAKAGDVRLPGQPAKAAGDMSKNGSARQRIRWSAKGLREAFVASEILAKPSCLRI
jgi:hypothetical protein